MKPNILFLLLTAAIITSFQSSPIRIKKTVNLKTGSITEYFYDSIGRIVKVQNSNGAKTTYEYAGNRIIKFLSSPSTGETSVDTFFINSQNRVATIKSSNGFISKCDYDSKGKFIKIENYDGGNFIGKSVWKWDGENLHTNIAYNSKGDVLSTINYFYTQNANTISQTYTGMEFMGQDSKHLVKESLSVWNDTTLLTYKYQFDTQRAMKLKLKASYNKKGELIDSIAYTYY